MSILSAAILNVSILKAAFFIVMLSVVIMKVVMLSAAFFIVILTEFLGIVQYNNSSSFPVHRGC